MVQKKLSGRFRIRQATPEDVVDAVAVVAQSWQLTYADSVPTSVLTSHRDPDRLAHQAAAWRQVMEQGGYFWLVVDSDSANALVGVAHACIGEDPTAAVPLELALLYLLPVAHGSGIADRLLEIAVGDAPAYLWIVDPNPRAEAFYRRHGFVRDGASKQRDDGVVCVRLLRS